MLKPIKQHFIGDSYIIVPSGTYNNIHFSLNVGHNIGLNSAHSIVNSGNMLIQKQ
jgi:hypothetical protein